MIFPILTVIIIHEIMTLRLIKAFIFAVSYFIKKLQIILKLIRTVRLSVRLVLHGCRRCGHLLSVRRRNLEKITYVNCKFYANSSNNQTGGHFKYNRFNFQSLIQIKKNLTFIIWTNKLIHTSIKSINSFYNVYYTNVYTVYHLHYV